MAIALLQKEIARFLSSSEPEVICITGNWGVGKTFAWNKFLRDAKDQKAIRLRRYSYVSLFGVNSLDELKYSIFENSIDSSNVDVVPSLETLKSNTAAVTRQVGRRSLGLIQQLPFIKSYIGNIGPAWFLSVKSTIVCIDDIERHGKGLTVLDIVGLASHLKESKRCKVALILNDEALEGEKQDFKKYFEKVIDSYLRFEPSSEECATLAIARSTETGQLIAKHVVGLGISNIRVIKKIERLVSKVEPLLQPFEKEIFEQAVHTLTLLGWSIFEPGDAPSIDFLQQRERRFISSKEKKEIGPHDDAWDALLGSYKFTNLDDFDSVLLAGVKTGYFNEAEVAKKAKDLDAQVRSGKLNNSFIVAWEKFHDSFNDDQDDILEGLYKSAIDNIRNISLSNMSSTIELFKELGHSDQAAELINIYVEQNGDQLAELMRSHFATDVRDPDLVRAIKEKQATIKPTRDPVLVLKSIRNGWNPEDIVLLSELPVEEYVKIFKAAVGDELRLILQSCFQFDNVSNASEPMKEIPIRAREALSVIGKESAINAQRVRRFGVKV